MENPPLESVPSVAETTVTPQETVRVKRSTDNRSLLLAFVAIVILGSAYGYRSMFVAATIDGSPVSRLAVIRQLEKQGGESALNAIITERLIAAEAARAEIKISADDIDKEIDNIKTQVSAQGATLDDALAQQGMTMDDLRKQITTQKQLKALLGDSLTVTDSDIDDYLATSKITPPKNMTQDDFRAKIKEQLSNQKFGKEADRWINATREKANIKYFVGYGKAPAITPPADSSTP